MMKNGVWSVFISLIVNLNIANDTFIVQFSAKQVVKNRYEIRIEPSGIILKNGYACEFEIFIKPLCTCNINNDQIAINYQILNSKDNKINQTIIPMKYIQLK